MRSRRAARVLCFPLSIAALAPAAAAQGYVFELDGIEVDGAGVSIEEPFGIVPTYAVAWDLVYVVNDPSYASQLNLVLEHVPSGFTITFDGWDGNVGDTGPDDILFGWGDEGGTFSSFGSAPFDDLVVGAQDWRLTIFDEVDDPGVDGVLYGTVSVYEIPAPPAMVAGALASALTARRRRR